MSWAVVGDRAGWTRRHGVWTVPVAVRSVGGPARDDHLGAPARPIMTPSAFRARLAAHRVPGFRTRCVCVAASVPSVKMASVSITVVLNESFV